MLSWLIYCTLNFSFCIANPVCITNDCIMYTTYRYRLYTRYTFYCCSSKELLLFSKLKVRIFKICLIVWQMLHLLKNFWAQIIFFFVPFSISSVINITSTSSPSTLPTGWPNHGHLPGWWVTLTYHLRTLMTNNSQMAIYPFFLSNAPNFDLHLKTLQLLANFHFLVVPQPTSDASSLVDSYNHI